jgi:hypothetical protein
MKKIAICLMMTFMSLTLIPVQLNAKTREPSSATAPTPAETKEANALLLRLNEIKGMEKSKMETAEKKTLRKEVKSIKHRLREVGGGVYLSAAAIILIVILIVVLI